MSYIITYSLLLLCYKSVCECVWHQESDFSVVIFILFVSTAADKLLMMAFFGEKRVCKFLTITCGCKVVSLNAITC